jgi:PAS domain S-box-containing protein
VKIGAKLITTSLMQAMLLGVAGYVILNRFTELNDAFSRISEQNIPAVQAMNAIAENSTHAVAEAQLYMSAADGKRPLTGFRASFESIDRALGTYQRIIEQSRFHDDLTERSKALVEEMRVPIERLRRASEATFGKVPSEISATERYRSSKRLWVIHRKALSTLTRATNLQAQGLLNHTSELSKSFRTARMSTGVLLMANLVLTFTLFLALSRRISFPMRRLTAVVRKIAAGGRKERAQVRAGDEIGDLATAFNDMANELLSGEIVRAERDHLNTVMNTIGDSLVVLNPRGAITRVNPATCALLDYQEDELAGAPFVPTLADMDSATFPSAPSISQATGVRNISIGYRAKDGTVIPMSLAFSAIQRNNGSIAGFVAVAHDMRNDLRFIEFIEELKTMRNQALEATRLKSEFLANVSHEIRTPMNAIIGMTDMALDTELTAEQRDYLDTVKSSSRALLTLLNDILDLSKIEAGKLDLEHIPFSLRESIDETLRTYALRAHQKGLELICNIAPDVPDDLLGDPGRLCQIVTNLIGNALKFTDHGEVVVRMRADAVTERAANLHLAVIDTGIGIAPEHRKAIFAPFVQADGSMIRRYGGTGLGLAICTQLVEILGGRIWVESEVGRGSVFHVTAHVERQPACDRVPGSGDVGLLGDVAVLIVDDNTTSRGTLVEMAKSWGMAPLGVADATAALAALEHAQAAGAPFALALVDVEMPGMDGIALARRIEDDARLAAVPLLLMVSAGQRLAKVESAPAVAGVVYKPIRASHLLEAIQAVRSGRAACQGDAKASAPPLVNGAGERVLLAEDNAVNQRLVAGMLEKRGYRVTVVADGRQALAALEHERFDVVLMDVQMPVMDGFEATATIRAREQTSGAHVRSSRSRRTLCKATARAASRPAWTPTLPSRSKPRSSWQHSRAWLPEAPSRSPGRRPCRQPQHRCWIGRRSCGGRAATSRSCSRWWPCFERRRRRSWPRSAAGSRDATRRPSHARLTRSRGRSQRSPPALPPTRRCASRRLGARAT